MKAGVFRDGAPCSVEDVTDIPEEITASIIRVKNTLMVDAVSTSETSVRIYQYGATS
jgi:hypothetical protein